MDSSPDPLLLSPPRGKLLALDVGLARIGVAVCDGLQMTVRPLTVVERRSRNDDFATLAQIAQREDVQALVCGLPLNIDGSDGPQAATTRRWAMRLAQAMRALLHRPLPVVFWDERLTTYAAQELMAGKKSSGSAYATDDAVAAAVLLQTYLDATARGEQLHFGRIDLPPRRASDEGTAPTEA